LAAEALLPHMQAGAVASVAGEALELRSDHDHQVLRVVEPHSVALFEHLREPAEAPEPDLFATATGA
jgi:hypothetical protein